MRSRATSFQLLSGWVCHQRAMYVCSVERSASVAVAEPLIFTSLNSLAQSALPRAKGAAERNCEELVIRNGFTAPIQPVGSRIRPEAFESGHQCPTPVFGIHWDLPNRPSPWRAAII